MSEVVLGTVQFGLPYGVTNTKKEEVPLKEVQKIIHTAYRRGVRLLDTAYSYGKSEPVLGQVLSQDSTLEFKLISKTFSFDQIARIQKENISKLQKAFEESLILLQVDSIYGLLVHHAEDLLKPGSELIYEFLLDLKKQGMIQKLGCSFYAPIQLENVYQKFPLDLIQIPLNLLDQRFLKNSLINKMHEQGVEIHARSLFLQGLLLANPEKISSSMVYAKPTLMKVHDFCKQQGITPLQLAVLFMKSLKDIKFVMGFLKEAELIQIMHELENKQQECVNINFDDLAINDEKIINPSLWPR